MSLLQAAKGAADYSTFAASVESTNANPRKHASWFARLFLMWCNPMLQLGNEKQLSMDDMWALDDSNTSDTSCSELETHWASSGSLLVAFVRSYGGLYAGVGVLLASAYGCDLLGPWILNQVVALVSDPSARVQDIYGWLALLFVSRVLKALLFAHAYKETQVVALRFTAAVKGRLFRKSMRLSATSRAKKGTDITNLYTTDVGNLLMAAYYVHEMWILPLVICLSLSMLFHVVGYAALAGVSVIVLVLCVNQLIARVLASAFESLMAIKDERMKAVQELFGAIQIVKLNAWEPKFLAKITAIRARELRLVRTYLYVGALNIFALWGAPVWVSTATFAVFALVLHESLTAARVFTALALFRLMQEPLRSLPKIITGMIQAHVSLTRILAYVDLPERKADVLSTDADVAARMDASGVSVSIEDGSFAWDNMLLFSGINLTAKTGDLVIVHGKVGSGKSSLLSVLLGDMNKQTGLVYVGGSIAYCPQQPWIQHMTIRDNICFGRPYDRKKYAKVIDACLLATDLAALPAGDRTEVGQKGLNLSGGQKARISLARACYSDADIYLLDAPLAAVDATVASEIFAKCILGLLRHKTRVLITHNPDLIASKAVDSVLKLTDGQLSHVRNIDKETLGPPPVSPLMGSTNRHRKPKAQKGGKDPKPAFAATSPSQVVQDGFAPLVSRSSSFLRYDSAHDGKLVKEEERHEGRVSAHVFAAYFKAMGGVHVVGFLVVVQLTWQALMQASDFYLAYWTTEPDDVQQNSVTTNLTYYAVLALGSCLLVLVRTLTVSFCGITAATRLFDEMTKSLLRAPMAFFDANPVGRILNRYSDDVSRVDFQLPFAYGSLLAVGFSVGCTLLTACVMARCFGLLVIPILAIYVYVGLFYLQPARELQRLQKVTQSPILAHLSESNDGCAVIRAFDQVPRFCSENGRLIDVNNQTVYVNIMTAQWFAMRMQLMGGVIVVLIAVSLTSMRAVLTPGIVGLAFNYGLAVDQGLEGLIQIWSWLETSMVSPERMQEYIDVTPESDSESDSVSSDWPVAGRVVFENVSFRYKTGDKLVLDNVSFSIAAGEKVSIVGRTGAGKSSLTMALFRIQDVAGGRILIDDVNIATLPLKTLRSRLSIVTQTPVLFKGSLRGYLDPFDEYADEDLWQALKKVELAIKALDAPLEENGENWSVGERQMLCMARALLSEARVVIMDEATAAVDADTDAKLQKVIRTEFKAATVLTIAHRLDTVLDGDRILVLDAGRVVQFDTPTRLIDEGDGPFYHLAKDGGYV
ncbi:Aste57867_13085 [Aphanomyces stellatus]|uniref:Aste57867_13085 protein n=1 Tax=Aphanomyces stellatus TaxID=120398 RepID=A0A485KXX3_9STRA|nr:hypothetical protein As57867_013037 [Aphanomyces stellatus]VFT89929.1 Aste57867_13085 [Aphanomyces stellatus]